MAVYCKLTREPCPYQDPNDCWYYRETNVTGDCPWKQEVRTGVPSQDEQGDSR